jgi:hypothetical protein
VLTSLRCVLTLLRRVLTVLRCAYASCERAPSAATVEAFAADNALFVREFSKVFQKLLEHGCADDLRPTGDSAQPPAVRRWKNSCES